MLNAVISLLTGDATLNSTLNNKIFATRAPQKINGSAVNPPLVVMLRAGSDSNKCKDDSGGILDEIDITILIMSLRYGQCNSLAKSIRDILDNYNGVSEGENIMIDFITQSDSFSDEAKLYVRNMSFKVWHKE